MPLAFNANDVGYDVLLVIGQSNAAGYNTTQDPKLDFADPRVEAWGTTGPYIDQKFVAYDPDPSTGAGTGISFSIPFAKWYVSAIPSNRKVLIVNAAVGGSQLVDSAWDTPNGVFYLNAVARTNAAIAALPHTRLAAMLWLQGESDAVSKISNERYTARLDLLIAALRANITAAAEVPFLIASMLDIWRLQPELASNNTVTVAEVDEIHQAHITTPYRVPLCAYVEGTTGPAARSADFIHYSAAGQRENGKRLLFTAMPAALINTAGSLNAPALPGNFSVSTVASGSVSFGWSAVSNAGLYELDYKPASSSTWVPATRRSKPGAQVNGLVNGTAYEFRLRAVNHGGASAYTVLGATPVGTGNDEAWSRIRASSVILDNAGLVQIATDVSNHARDWVQSLAAGRFQLGTVGTLTVLKMTPTTALQTALPSANGSYTKMCLVHHDAISAPGVNNYMSGYQNNNDCHLFWRINTTAMQAAHNTTNSNLTCSTALVASKWYMLVLTYDANSAAMNFYVNGSAVGSASVSVKPSTATFWLGGISVTPAGGATANCLEAAVWNTALSPAQVLAERDGLAQRYGLVLN